MTNFRMDLHWPHAVGAAVVLLLLVLSVVLAGKYRPAWLACMSALCMAGVVGLWIRNRYSHEAAGVLYQSVSPTGACKSYQLKIQSDGGSLRLLWEHGLFTVPSLPVSTEIVLKCQSQGKQYAFVPQVSPGRTLVGGQVLGFGMTLESLPWDAAALHYWDRWEFMIPSWFALSALGLFPARWLYMHKWGHKAYARKHNLCLKCAYCLNGLPAPVRCPECGTPRDSASPVARSA